MKKTLVLFHSPCYDGFGAAWSAWRYFGDDAVYQEAAYGKPIKVPDIFAKVYILDFSLPRAELIALSERLEVLKVLDHHATAQQNLEGLGFCEFDLEKSGARLAWEHFHGRDNVPQLIRYVEDRDLWRYALPWSREIHAWLQSYPREFQLWSKLAGMLENDFANISEHAKAIVRFKQMQVREMADHAQWAILNGYRVPIANATAFFSEVGEELCQRFPDAPFAGYFLDRADGLRQWGLRSKNGFNVSEVAKTYGGGGHPSAAGFTSEQGWFPRSE